MKTFVLSERQFIITAALRWSAVWIQRVHERKKSPTSQTFQPRRARTHHEVV